MLGYLSDDLTGAAAPARSVIRPVDRRAFLRGSAAGLALAAFAGRAGAFERYPTGGSDMPNGLVRDPLVFVSIDPDGTVTLIAHRSEMGTGVRTSLPMVIADEMEADWSRVVIEQAPGDEPKYGNQNTDGSRSMRHHIQTMRQMGASVRHMLARAAAKRWGVEPSAVTVELHTVRAPDGRSAGFGDLAEEAMAEPVPPFEELSFKSEDEFRYIGTGEVPITDMHDIVTGKAVYGADVMLEGMLTAVVAHPPVVGGKVVSHDASKARAVPGVEAVIELSGAALPGKFAPLGGVAVVATNTWAAIRGRQALEIEWDHGPNASYNTKEYRRQMEETAEKGGKVLRETGDVDGAFENADRVITRSYYQDHMAQMPMEPPAAVARWADGHMEVWAPAQSPYTLRKDIADDLGLMVEDVTVHVTLLGGGFGRKSKGDFATEAARLARETGRPVRVQWTRDDDVRHSFYHTTSVERIAAAVDGDGRVTGWKHTSVAPTILSTFAEDPKYQFNIENGMGHVDMPFAIPNIRCDNGPAPAHTRIGWWRSVSNVPRAFAVQSFAGELAAELGRDQREFLLELIGPDRVISPEEEGFPDDFWNYGDPYEEFPIDTARLKHVLNVAADAAGWGREMPEGEGLGLAVHRSFLTYVGTAAHVRIDGDGRIRMPEVHMAVDCGFAANPERIRSQMEGAAVMGMTLALHSAITHENGRVQQSNFNDYDVVRSDNYPEKVVTHIVEHPFSVHAAGVGEPGVPPIAPAMLNAIHNATGKRLRDLPVGEYMPA
jgi:isoquinoline 1-oxidoreductase beta subunit